MLTWSRRFRWVVCQLDRLRRTLPVSIRKVLNDLPQTLNETYSRTLLGIDERETRICPTNFLMSHGIYSPSSCQRARGDPCNSVGRGSPPSFNTDWRSSYAEETITSVCSSL